VFGYLENANRVLGNIDRFRTSTALKIQKSPRLPASLSIPLPDLSVSSTNRRYTGVVRMRTSFPLAAVAFLLGAVEARAAEPSPVLLTWNAPDGCPPADAVLHEVHRSLGAKTTHRLVARADVTQAGAERWSVHLVTEVDGAVGERSLDANSCVALANATALILAWTVDPTAARADDRALPASSPPPPAEAPPSERASTRESPRAIAAASGQVDLGTLPSASGGVGITLGAAWGPFRAEVTGSDWASQDARGASGGANLHLLEGEFRACVRVLRGSGLELFPCLGAGVVRASSDGFGLTPTYQMTRSWGSVGGDVLGTFALLGPIALRASIGVVAPVVRPPFVVIDPQGRELPFHQAAAVSGRASFGAEVRFP
jgi:hypothetical protein